MFGLSLWFCPKSCLLPQSCQFCQIQSLFLKFLPMPVRSFVRIICFLSTGFLLVRPSRVLLPPLLIGSRYLPLGSSPFVTCCTWCLGSVLLAIQGNKSVWVTDSRSLSQSLLPACTKQRHSSRRAKKLWDVPPIARLGGTCPTQIGLLRQLSYLKVLAMAKPCSVLYPQSKSGTGWRSWFPDGHSLAKEMMPACDRTSPKIQHRRDYVFKFCSRWDIQLFFPRWGPRHNINYYRISYAFSPRPWLVYEWDALQNILEK